MAGFRIEGNTSGNVAEVTPENALIVALGNDSLDNGILAITGRSDAGDFTGTPLDIDPEVDADYRMRVAQDRLDFQETFSGAALNSAQWSSTVTTMATAVSGSYLSLNSANSVATSAVARVQSYRSFVLTPGGALELDIPIKVVAASVGIANTTWELGFFLASGITAPPAICSSSRHSVAPRRSRPRSRSPRPPLAGIRRSCRRTWIAKCSSWSRHRPCTSG